MMHDMMSGWGMAGMGLIGILVLVVLILCVAFRARATSGFAQQRSNRDKSRIARRSHKVKIKQVQINSTPAALKVVLIDLRTMNIYPPRTGFRRNRCGFVVV